MGSQHRKVFKDPESAILPIAPRPRGERRQRMADRVDGASGSGDAYRQRSRRGSTEPLGLSDGELLEAIVALESTWTTGQLYDSYVDNGGVGRPLRISGMEVVLIEIAAAVFGSVRKAVRELHDHHVWSRLRRVALANSKALPEQPPSRSQYLRFRDRYLLDVEAGLAIREFNRQAAVRVAQTIGLFDPPLGSFSRPDPRNTVVGDGTWLRSLYNRPPDDVLYDANGERTRRIDPDGVRRNPQDMVTGRDVVSILARNAFTHERVMVDVCIKPTDRGGRRHLR